jgi:peptidylprolyl isomerase
MSDAPEVLTPPAETEVKDIPEKKECKCDPDSCEKDETCEGRPEKTEEEKKKEEEEPYPEPVLLEDGTYDLYPKEPKKCIKKIIKEGSGESPKKKDLVQVHYRGTLEDGKEFDTSQKRGIFEFQLGVGQVIRGWDLGVASMKVGDVVDLVLTPEFAYGANGSPPTIPGNANLTFNVELLGFEPHPNTLAERIKYANARKIAGNENVKKSQWTFAVSEYERAISMLRHERADTEDERKERDTLFAALHGNKALSCLKLDDAMGCGTSCDEVLKIEPTNAKALYRRGMAWKLLNEFDHSLADLAEAARNAPQDKQIRDDIEKVKELRKKKRDKEQAAFGNMFEKLQTMSDEDVKTREETDRKFATLREKEEKQLKEEAEKKRILDIKKKKLAKRRAEAAATAAANEKDTEQKEEKEEKKDEEKKD